MKKSGKSKLKSEAALNEPEKVLHKFNPPQIESTPLVVWRDERDQTRIAVDPKIDGIDPIKHITGTKDQEIGSNILYSGVCAITPIIDKRPGCADNMDKCLNIISQSLYDFKPKDAIEGRLVTQAAALYQHGMDRLGRLGRSGELNHSEAHANMAIKLLRVHNETIEALNRYRRGGEQKVTVTHVAEKMAVVNNYGCGGGGGAHENRGDNPCQQYAEPKQEPMSLSHVDSLQWRTEDVDCTGVNAQGLRQKKGKKGSN